MIIKDKIESTNHSIKMDQRKAERDQPCLNLSLKIPVTASNVEISFSKSKIIKTFLHSKIEQC